MNEQLLNQQPELPGLNPLQAEQLRDALNKGMGNATLSFDETDHSFRVTVSGAGVYSVFKINPDTHEYTFMPEASADAVTDSAVHSETELRPVKPAEEFHKERADALKAIIADIIDPPVVEVDV